MDELTITAAVSGHKPSVMSLYLILRACEQWCHHFHFTVENSEGAETFSTWSKVTKLEAKPTFKLRVTRFLSITPYL